MAALLTGGTQTRSGPLTLPFQPLPTADSSREAHLTYTADTHVQKYTSEVLSLDMKHFKSLKRSWDSPVNRKAKTVASDSQHRLPLANESTTCVNTGSSQRVMSVMTPERSVCKIHHHQQQLDSRLLSPGPASLGDELSNQPYRPVVRTQYRLSDLGLPALFWHWFHHHWWKIRFADTG